MVHNDYYVYVLFRETGQPFYIGKGRGKRMYQHERPSDKLTKGKNPHKISIIATMLAAGWTDIPKIKIAENLTHKQACAYEIAWIRALGRKPNGPLVNLTDGGDGKTGTAHSAQSRAKMSNSHRGKPHQPEHRANLAASNRARAVSPEWLQMMREITSSPEWRENMLLANRKINASPEVRAKMRIASLNNWTSPDYRGGMRGRKHSEKSRKKISEAARALAASPEWREKVATGTRIGLAKQRRHSNAVPVE